MKGFRARMAGQITVYLNPFQARSNSMCCVLLFKICVPQGRFYGSTGERNNPFGKCIKFPLRLCAKGRNTLNLFFVCDIFKRLRQGNLSAPIRCEKTVSKQKPSYCSFSNSLAEFTGSVNKITLIFRRHARRKISLRRSLCEPSRRPTERSEGDGARVFQKRAAKRLSFEYLTSCG